MQEHRQKRSDTNGRKLATRYMLDKCRGGTCISFTGGWMGLDARRSGLDGTPFAGKTGSASKPFHAHIRKTWNFFPFPVPFCLAPGFGR